MVKATLVIPVYNACTGKQKETWLKRLYESLRAQTFEDWEALFINDGSSDNSLRVLRRFEKADSRVKVIDKENEGVANTRNLGIGMANGDYIFFVDQDDYLEKDYLWRFIDAAEENHANIVVGGYCRLNSSGKEVSRLDPVIGNGFYKWCILVPWARVFKTEFLRDHGLTFFDNNIGEDLPFNIRAYFAACEAEGSVVLIDYVGYIWFYNEESVSNTSHKGLKQSVELDLLLQTLANIEVPEREQRYYSQFIVRFVVWYLLYSGRNADPQRFRDVSKTLMVWLDEKGFRPQFHFWAKEIRCESLLNRIAVSAYYYIFSKPGFVTLFSKLYCSPLS